MTREEFIKVLDNKNYTYEIEGDKIVVTYEGNTDLLSSVHLPALTSLPSEVVFENEGNVNLHSLTSLPPRVKFKNGRNVYLNSLTSLPPVTEFNNGGHVDLESLTSLPPGTQFNNNEDVNLKSLVGGWFGDLGINIKGVGSNRLLNLMIKKELFI
jgi:hypothetical protein